MAVKLMNDDQLRLERASGSPVCHIAIAATFTAEPVAEALAFWMQEIGRPGSINSPRITKSFRSFLIRTVCLEETARASTSFCFGSKIGCEFHERANSRRDFKSILLQNADDLINVVQSTMARSSTPLIVAFCPESPVGLGDAEIRKVCSQMRTKSQPRSTRFPTSA